MLGGRFRKYIAKVDATALLEDFARQQEASVPAHMWDAPRRALWAASMTGQDAWVAARSAAALASGAAAWATNCAWPARDAARSAALAAARLSFAAQVAALFV
jgi:hypothetical protein